MKLKLYDLYDVLFITIYSYLDDRTLYSVKVVYKDFLNTSIGKKMCSDNDYER